MGRAQAQATAQRQQAITNQDSFQLVKCLIRVSVYHVCWMRGLFPEGSFTGHDLAQLDQLHVKMLEPDEEDDEATTLKKWVEQGVMDAVSKGYLKNMYFGIAQDAAATNLLEEYIYSFRYGEEGVEFEMAATAHSKKKDKYNSKNKDRQRPGVDDVRYQVVRLMRMLVQLCQTLDKVPEERYLFIKLTYHDHAPADYEPPFFHGVAEEGIGHFRRRPFSMDVGCMDTHHHMVSVRVKSVLDSCDDDEGVAGDDAMMELQASQQVCPAAGGSAPSGTDEDMGEAGGDTPGRSQQEAGGVTALVAAAADISPDTNRHRTEEALAMLTATEDQAALLMETEGSLPQQEGTGMAAGQQAGPTDSQDVTRMTDDHMEDEARGTSAGLPSGGCSGQAAYESVRSFCLQRPTVSYVDLMATFYDLSEEQLAKVLDGLVREGLIQAGHQKDTYKVMQPSRAAPPAPQPPTASEGIMAEAGAGSGGSVAAAAAAGPMNMNGNAADLAEDQLLNNQMSGLSVGAAAAGRKARGAAGLDASVYGAAMRAGSLMTGQPGPPAGAPTAADLQTHQAAGDEPSVQLQQDQQGSLWFDASQHSFQGPHAATGGGSNAAVGGAAAGAAAGNSKLRKASYVNSPIYQHPGKRGPGSRLHQQQQQQEIVGEAEQEQEQQKAAAATPAPDAVMAPPRKKLTVRKPKKPAAATTAAAGTPARGRLAAMKG